MPVTKLAYLNAPLTMQFESRLLSEQPLSDGRFDVVLQETYFYPTGGGQQHDTGTLNTARVLDVIKDDAGTVVHRVDRAVGGPVVLGRIDFARRFGNMQHHTAQHILSCAVTEVLGLATLSAHIDAEMPSTIDVPDSALGWPTLEQAERRANEIVFENRAVKSYFVVDTDIGSIPFRRPPKVSGQIRVVEIDGWDWSACGGTHVAFTGGVGLIKIVRTERKNQKLRLHFVAGLQALTHAQLLTRVGAEVSHHFSAQLEAVPQLAAQQTEALKSAQKEIALLKSKLLPVEAGELVAAAQPVAGIQFVSQIYPDKNGGELRELARLLQAEDKLVAVLSGSMDGRLSLVVSCGVQTKVKARELLQHLLAPFNGRGGGDDRLAQGGGQIDGADASQLANLAQSYLTLNKKRGYIDPV